jgi:aminoglycoside phosphotransferase (APT) family kinase protein
MPVRPDVDLAARLVAEQFPQWADLPLAPVSPDGWDNRTFRLGDELCVRLPSADRYAAQVDKEQRWLPVLAPRLPLPIPQPVERGAPGRGFPWPWSVYRWLPGEPAAVAPVDDLDRLAGDLAAFLVALARVDPAGGPAPGDHNFFRGGPLRIYDRDTREAITALHDQVEAAAAIEVWEAALAAPWHGPPAWLHGDVGAGNLLVADGRLSAVLDFGCMAVGDPACDVTIAWTFFSGESRSTFRAHLGHDEATWARGRGWALWKALVTLHHGEPSRDQASRARAVIADVLGDQPRVGPATGG